MRQLTKPIRTALIGAGNSGKFYHLPHLRDPARFDLRLVVAEHAGSAVDVAQDAGAEASTDWRHAVDRPDIELLVVALPHKMHHPVVLEALRNGKHVLVEKPLALTIADADELVEAAQRAGTVLLVHHQRRWEADFETIHEIVKSGEIGELWRANLARSHQGRYHKPSSQRPHAGAEIVTWAHEQNQGGGIAQVVGPHPVDHLLTLVRSEVTAVTAQTHSEAGDDVEDWIGIDLSFASQATGRVEVFRWSGIQPPRFAVYGTKGTAVSSGGEHVEVHLRNGSKRVIENLPMPGILGGEIYEDLFNAIRYGRPPRVTSTQARDVVEVLDLSRRSSQDGGRLVQVRPTPESVSIRTQQTPAERT